MVYLQLENKSIPIGNVTFIYDTTQNEEFLINFMMLRKI